ncbi:uncharacterized protein LAESUDRAFT_428491 [Laetiporus sulphureus 93-53]|uniref:Uncharacterized protein n=1 Tax=Laetiporus sulphureus 93-53 TaxID=1314785 RepID=A0A165GLL5_9APHY|nr:uncharacterized protein LAESUDRAFT_428491 [Laetiporus sulphureus 93-53]KZT10521.1 hypothetical protein LAESUDRAFT_428491 [Laetiporus sulphureus 93-53]
MPPRVCRSIRPARPLLATALRPTRYASRSRSDHRGVILTPLPQSQVMPKQLESRHQKRSRSNNTLADASKSPHKVDRGRSPRPSTGRKSFVRRRSRTHSPFKRPKTPKKTLATLVAQARSPKKQERSPMKTDIEEATGANDAASGADTEVTKRASNNDDKKYADLEDYFPHRSAFPSPQTYRRYRDSDGKWTTVAEGYPQPIIPLIPKSPLLGQKDMGMGKGKAKGTTDTLIEESKAHQEWAAMRQLILTWEATEIDEEEQYAILDDF